MLLIKEGKWIVLDDIAKLELLFVLMLAALFQLFQSFDIDIFTSGRYLSSQVYPPTTQFRTLYLPVTKHLQLLFHDGGRRCVQLVSFDDVLFFGFVSATRGYVEVLVVVLLKG